jgi:glucans biosynthesis protein
MIGRRAFLQLGAAMALAARPAAAVPPLEPEAEPFSYDWLQQEAMRLSEAPFAPAPEVPQEWRDLTFDQYRKIWWDSREALWTGTDRPHRVDFFAPGLYFPRPVEICVVEDGMARRVAFDLESFDRTDKFPDVPVDETLGYSGLRLRAELRQEAIHEEFAVFQGASYFRAIGTGQTYGLSARGLALRTADPEGEEFPEFTRFWLEAPDPGARTIRMYALLDGESTTGAYRFDISHGHPCRMEVEATLYPRRELARAGLAPLTSMFLFDATNRDRFDDFRDAVHDSEGLLVWNGAGERLWRPLANPARLQVSEFLDDGPRGFGLIQRDRSVEGYGDLEAHYHERPSLWITPRGDWGPGSVTLVEIPADMEIYDNIVAFWRPREPLAAGGPHRFSYGMEWGDGPGEGGAEGIRPAAAVLQTRIGQGYDKSAEGTIVTIDYADHEGFADLEAVTPIVSASRGEVEPGILQRNPGTGGVRLGFRFRPGDAEQSELRAQLVAGGRTFAEVWLYRWTP